jgi:hypothetical protein
MKSSMDAGLRIYVALLTLWVAVITTVLIIDAIDRGRHSRYDPEAMFARWQGDRLNLSQGAGVYFITHLRNLENHSIAELPKPIVAASSGGVNIPVSDLAKLNWIVPPDTHDSAFVSATTTNVTATPPRVGTPVEALYLFPAHAKFKR